MPWTPRATRTGSSQDPSRFAQLPFSSDPEAPLSQQILGGAPEGWVRVQFRFSFLHEVMDWILALGSQARALEPPALRDMLRTELAAMHRHYADDGAG